MLEKDAEVLFDSGVVDLRRSFSDATQGAFIHHRASGILETLFGRCCNSHLVSIPFSVKSSRGARGLFLGAVTTLVELKGVVGWIVKLI